MAGELQADYVTGRPVYFVLRNEQGHPYSVTGAAFEAYVAAHWANYAISGLEQGGSGFYVGDLPAVGPGVYSVVAKDRQGGSPSESDPTIGGDNLEWPRLWRRFFRKAVRDGSTIRCYEDDGTTVQTTQAYTSDAGAETVGAAA